ncbi:MAG: ABC transporter substrate-binding protein [Ectothiorhodospiraceae bacterium]|nr:ABC transporter substrate-binding protein [Chromatiales bacterium]MCP5155457.1 ABC transporter substrate-binding protein [Ectothiorhodospiraceae bacterium]
MKTRTTAWLAAAALMLGAAVVHAKDYKKLRIGVEGAYPPFSEVTPDGKLQGFDIDIAMALCAEIGAECSLVQQDWDGIIPALLARKYDAIIASMSITEERKKKVAFTDKYYNTPAKFARRKGSGIEIDPASMKGKAVGVQRATTHDNFITATYGDAVEVKRYASQDEAYLDAVAGRVDLLLADSVAMSDGFLKTDNGKDWEFVGPDFVDPKFFGEGAGIAVRKDDPELVELFNKAIATIRANGKYKEINDKYFPFDVFGN